jgi:hypothetical protein
MKSKRYWLWGGLIGAVFAIILTLFWLVIGCAPSGFLGGNGWRVCQSWFMESISWIIFLIQTITSFPLMFLISWIKIIDRSTTLSIIVSVIYYILLGALLGWLYGKIKKRREK